MHGLAKISASTGTMLKERTRGIISSTTSTVHLGGFFGRLEVSTQGSSTQGDLEIVTFSFLNAY